jgi:hypothetical protein
MIKNPWKPKLLSLYWLRKSIMVDSHPLPLVLIGKMAE